MSRPPRDHHIPEYLDIRQIKRYWNRIALTYVRKQGHRLQRFEDSLWSVRDGRASGLVRCTRCQRGGAVSSELGRHFAGPLFDSPCQDVPRRGMDYAVESYIADRATLRL